jgi:short-subunit dehydrogenase
MKRELRDKRILITGASSGIGRALALECAARGARVLLAARTVEALDEAADRIRANGGVAVVRPADVTVPRDREEMFATAIREFGGLDVLVNNAGVAAHGHFVDLPPEILRRTMELNFFALAECCRLAIPILAEGRAPLIVNVSSMAGRRGVPAWTDYSASKFAVCGFSEALRAELVRFGVDLTLVVPGLTNSNFGRHLMARRGRMPARFDHGLSPEVVARKIADAMQRGKHEVRIERDARLLLFVNWLAPRFVDWRMARIVRRLYAREIEQRRRGSAASPFPAEAA